MKVVAKKYFFNQSSDLSSVNMFTSTEGGDFLVAGVTSGGAGGSSSLQFTWTDELGAQLGTSLQDGSSGMNFVKLVHLLPGGSVFATTVGTFGGGNPNGNAFFVVSDLAAPGL